MVYCMQLTDLNLQASINSRSVLIESQDLGWSKSTLSTLSWSCMRAHCNGVYRGFNLQEA